MEWIKKLLRKDEKQTKWRANKGSVTVKLSGPGLTVPATFTLIKNGRLDLHTDFIDCDKGGTCNNKTPGVYRFEVLSIDVP